MTNLEKDPQFEGRLVLIRQKTGDATSYLATGVLSFEALKEKVLDVGLLQIIYDCSDNGDTDLFVENLIDLKRDVLSLEVMTEEE